MELFKSLFRRFIPLALDHIIDPRAFEFCRNHEVITGWLTERYGRTENIVVFYSPEQKEIVFIAGPYQTGQWKHDAHGQGVSLELARHELFPKGYEPPRKYARAIADFIRNIDLQMNSLKGEL